MKIKDIFFKTKEPISLTKKIINISLVILILVFITVYSFIKINYSVNFKDLFSYNSKLISGILITISISFFALIFSLIIGIILTILRNSKFLPFVYFSKIYVLFIRNTPLLVQIFLFFYIMGTAFNIENRYFLAPIILSIFSGAYISEIIRSGLNSIDSRQIETSISLGFNKFQILIYIIIPQLVRIILPTLSGQFISLIKDSSLLSVISVNEITKTIEEVNSLTFRVIENYLVLAAIYLIITIPIDYLSRYLERRFSLGYKD